MESNLRILKSIKALNESLEKTKAYQEEINKVQDNLDKAIEQETLKIKEIQEEIQNDIDKLEKKLQLNEEQIESQNKTIEDKINNIKIRIPKDGKDGINGKNGTDGIGIADVKVNEKGELIITLTNGKKINCGVVKGNSGYNGTNGTDGIGIYDIEINEKGELIITLTNGKKINCGVVKGKDGIGYNGISVTNAEIVNNHLIITLSTGREIDAGDISSSGGTTDYSDLTNKPSINNVTLSGNKTLSDLGIPTQTSELTNNSGFITNSVDNLTNYSLTTDIQANKSLTNGIEYIVGTQNEVTNLWTGISTDTGCKNGNLYTGKVIIYHLPQAGTSTSATLNLTLPDGTTTGAKNIYRLATTAVTTNFSAGCDILMVYDGTQWKINAYVDTNTNTIGYQLRTNSSVYKNGANTSIYRYQLLVETENGLEAFTSTNNTTKATKTQLSPKYIPGGNIRYYGSTTEVTSGSNIATGVLWQQYNVDLRYSFNITTSTFEIGKPVYIRMSKNNDGTLSPMYLLPSGSHPLTQELPTEVDSYVYVLLGQAYSGYQIELTPLHTMYEYKNGKIREYIEESSSGGGSGIQYFDVPIYWDDEEEIYKTDVTAEEIFSALEENKLIRIEDSGIYYVCTTTNIDEDFCFISSNFFEVESVTMFNYSLIVEDDEVTVDVRQLILQVV